jgi:hypothetical protein
MLSDNKTKETEILKRFIAVYCKEKHQGENLCEDCQKLEDYALTKLEKCPFDPKPKCRDCKVHCYQQEYRDKIKEVMRFSGMYHVKRGRVDWLIKYFLK